MSVTKDLEHELPDTYKYNFRPVIDIPRRYQPSYDNPHATFQPYQHNFVKHYSINRHLFRNSTPPNQHACTAGKNRGPEYP